MNLQVFNNEIRKAMILMWNILHTIFFYTIEYLFFIHSKKNLERDENVSGYAHFLPVRNTGSFS